MMIDENSAESIRNQLLVLGIEPAKAHEASVRFNTVEAAVTWVFGEGEAWTPGSSQPPPPPPQPSLNPFLPGVTARPPSPAAEQPQFASNNPFNTYYAAPAPPSGPPGAEREDDDLVRAIQMSTQEHESRQQRERSIRASAPPPSPGPIRMDAIVTPVFGPSNKDDPKGNMQLVTAGNNTPASNNKEEEDFQRAIQESMMTASFHSAGGESAEALPTPKDRDPSSPLAYVTRKDISWAANLMQGLAAVPQLRRLVDLGEKESDPPLFTALRNLLALQNSSEHSYQVIDTEVDLINSITGFPLSYVSLPPIQPMIDHSHGYIPAIIKTVKDVVTTRVRILQENPPTDESEPLLNLKMRDLLKCPDQLMSTRLSSQPVTDQNWVSIDRTSSTPSDIHGNLAGIIWDTSHPDDSIRFMADVVFVFIRRIPGVNVGKWNFDEDVVLDRYMSDNAAWSTQLRAEENVLKHELQRLQEQIETLSTFRGNSLPDALAALVKQLDTAPGLEGEDGRAALKAKLERIQSAVSAKLASYQEAAKAKEALITDGGLFTTDDPERNLHRYRLQSVLWHDGFTTGPGKRLYAYVRHRAAWHKVEETEVTQVDFETIQADSTGQYTDGGPYLLIYSRVGARPEGHSRTDLVTPQSDEPMEEVQATPEWAQTAPPDLLMERDDDPDEEVEVLDWKPDVTMASTSTSTSASVTTSTSPTSPSAGTGTGLPLSPARGASINVGSLHYGEAKDTPPVASPVSPVRAASINVGSQRVGEVRRPLPPRPGGVSQLGGKSPHPRES